MALGAAAAPFLLEIQANAQEWTFEPSVSVREVFTDNALLTSENEESDFITTLTVGWDLVGEGDRLQIDLSALVSYDKYIEFEELDGFRPEFLAVAEFEAIENTLFFDVRGRVFDRNISRSTATPAVDRSIDTNRTLVTDFSGGLRFLQDLNSQVAVNGQLQVATTAFNKPDVGDDTGAPDNEQDVQGRLGIGSSRPDARLQWEASGQFREEFGGGSDFSYQSGQLRVEYQFLRQFAAFVVGGYDEFDAADINEDERSGGFGLFGVRVQPGPRLSFAGSVGYRYGDLSGEASLNYQVGAFTSINAIYTEGVGTQQQEFNRGLNDLGFDEETGALVDALGLPPAVFDDDISLIDRSSKNSRLSVGVIRETPRTGFTASGFYLKRKFDSLGQDETVAGADASFRYSATPNLDFIFDAFYSQTLDGVVGFGGFGGEDDDDLGGAVRAIYAFTDTFTLEGGYSYRLQKRDMLGDISENAVFVVVRKTF